MASNNQEGRPSPKELRWPAIHSYQPPAAIPSQEQTQQAAQHHVAATTSSSNTSSPVAGGETSDATASVSDRNSSSIADVSSNSNDLSIQGHPTGVRSPQNHQNEHHTAVANQPNPSFGGSQPAQSLTAPHANTNTALSGARVPTRTTRPSYINPYDCKHRGGIAPCTPDFICDYDPRSYPAVLAHRHKHKRGGSDHDRENSHEENSFHEDYTFEEHLNLQNDRKALRNFLRQREWALGGFG